MKFRLIYTAQGGRRYFQNEKKDVAIADRSINAELDPASCEDGLLIFNFDKTPQLHGNHGYRVPLIDESGYDKTATVSTHDLGNVISASGRNFKNFKMMPPSFDD